MRTDGQRGSANVAREVIAAPMPRPRTSGWVATHSTWVQAPVVCAAAVARQAGRRHSRPNSGSRVRRGPSRPRGSPRRVPGTTRATPDAEVAHRVGVVGLDDGETVGVRERTPPGGRIMNGGWPTRSRPNPVRSGVGKADITSTGRPARRRRTCARLATRSGQACVAHRPSDDRAIGEEEVGADIEPGDIGVGAACGRRLPRPSPTIQSAKPVT